MGLYYPIKLEFYLRMKTALLKLGTLTVERTDKGGLRIVREDNMQAVQLSRSESEFVIRAMTELFMIPIAPDQEMEMGG